MIATWAVLVFTTALRTEHTFAQEAGWHKTNLASIYISSVANSPYGVLAGEQDSRAWLNPFNGVYMSTDLGMTWLQKGLNGRGVTDIDYFQNKVFATTYYTKSAMSGLFVSPDGLNTWQHLGPNFSTSSICANSQTLYLGSYSHGLWVSFDAGTNWTQKLGDVLIRTASCSENYSLVAASNNTYVSFDKGNNWKAISDLTGKVVSNLLILDTISFASTSEGLYTSHDSGNSWQKVTSLIDYKPGGITYFNDTLYIGAKFKSDNFTGVHQSKNLGDTWDTTGFNSTSYSEVDEMTWVFSDPSLLFANISSNGVYKYYIQKSQETFPFLSHLWKVTKPYEHYEKISAFFDHAYPLLGVSYPVEPSAENNTTVNFNGFRTLEPYLYYSSHNGTDFVLPYGTAITAPASGYAKYISCTPCGNTIEIDHQNSYQTKYMHLQNRELITLSADPLWVNLGDKLGLVGMTGNTTGPHLHFEVTQDTNTNGMFTDEAPRGKTDPFGWDPVGNQKDPWPIFAWTGQEQTYTGTTSKNLWINTLGQPGKFVEGTEVVTLENREVTVPAGCTQKPATLFLRLPGIPNTFPADSPLTYVEETGLNISLLDQLGNMVTILQNPVQIKILVPINILQHFVPDSLTLYGLDKITNLWTALPTIFDTSNNTITGETTHLSNFAIFGKRIIKKLKVSNSVFNVSQVFPTTEQ